MTGEGVEKDEAAGFALSENGARKGDVYAMINMTVFYTQGLGVPPSKDQALHWLDAAGKSGHWYGHLEKGIALLTGNYGCHINRPSGMAELQEMTKSGEGEALQAIASCYAKGYGLPVDGKRAVQFAKAAFRQGSQPAASILAEIYTHGLGEIRADREAAWIWGGEATQPGFGFQTTSPSNREALLLELKGLDPFALRVSAP